MKLHNPEILYRVFNISCAKHSARIMMVVFLLFLAPNLLHAMPNSSSHDKLKTFLQEYMKDPDSGADKTLRYSVANLSLSGSDKNEIFIYLTGRTVCGSGGCMALLLEPEGQSFRVITIFTLARLPVLVLPSETNGWHDLAMQVAGGGIMTPYTAILRFDGHHYPSNPSVVPKLSPEKAAAGKILPLSEEGELLY